MGTIKSHHFVGPLFWIGCALTPVLVAFLAWPLDGPGAIFMWLAISAVFAGFVGAFTQAIADLLRALRESRLSWIEFLFFGIIVIVAVVCGWTVYCFPAAGYLVRFGVVAAVPFLIAGIYARVRILRFRRRHGSPNV